MAAVPGAVSYYTAAGAPNPAFVEMFATEKGINLLGIAHVIDLGGGTNYHRTNQAYLFHCDEWFSWTLLGLFLKF
jgi:hypothetical protein